MAVTQRRATAVVPHSDQGSRYTAFAFGQRCQALGVQPSMGLVGDADDSAMGESFFATFDCGLWDRDHDPPRPARRPATPSTARRHQASRVGYPRTAASAPGADPQAGSKRNIAAGRKRAETSPANRLDWSWPRSSLRTPDLGAKSSRRSTQNTLGETVDSK